MSYFRLRKFFHLKEIIFFRIFFHKRLFHWKKLVFFSIKAVATDMRYFARSKLSRSLVHMKNFGVDMTSSFKVMIL